MTTNNFITKLKHLPHILSSRDQKLLSTLVALFLLSSAALIISVFHSLTQAVAQSGGHYTEGIVGRPRLPNPLYSENNPADRDIVALLYAGLVRFNGDHLAPDLAQEWKISDDQKTYTFHLREGMIWPDGEPFTSSDVAFTLTTIQNKAYQSPLQSSFAGITITASNDYTVVLELPKPHTPFLENLTVGILPEHIWSNVPPESISLTDFNTQPMGLGPFQFKQLSKTQFGTIHSYTLERNINYHLGSPFIKTLTLKFYSSFEEAQGALKRKEIEGLNFLPKTTITDTLPQSLTLHSLQLPQYTAIFFNLSSTAAVRNKQVRKAFAHAVNKRDILKKAISEDGRIIHGPILPSYPGYHPKIETFEFDLALATRLLEEAGWVRDDNGVFRDADDNPLEITLTTAQTPELTTAAERIQATLRLLGVIVELNIIDTALIQTSVISPRKFDMLLFGEIVGIDPDPFPFWHSSQISAQGLNLSNFKNTEADTVLEEARQTADQSKKSEKYIHFQNILVAELPAIFLYNPNYSYPVNKKVRGINQGRIITPSDRFANVHEWYIKTKRVFK